MIRLATCVDGRTLYYDATLYEFRLERELVSHADVLALDNHAHLQWCAAEQRDWFRRINPVDLDRCNRRALGRHGNYSGLTPEEQVQADAKRNDSVLAGKIVDADPALVRAVADALEAQGLVGRASGNAPQMVIGMPQGMEALSQLQKQEGRKMTLAEHYLMRQILKNDDKAKAKRERQEAEIEARAQKSAAREKKELEKTNRIQRAQKRVARQDAKEAAAVRKHSDERARADMGYRGAVGDASDESIDRALAIAEASSADRFRRPGVQEDDFDYTDEYGRPVYTSRAKQPRTSSTSSVSYTDSYGRPIRPEADAVRPDRSQVARVQSEEERALMEMRERNMAQQTLYSMQAADVPGMSEAGFGSARRGRNEGASVNGHEVNPDGTRKENAFTKFMGGLGKFNEAMSPLVGGGRGGGGMGGPGGGAGGGMGGSAGGGGGMGGMGGGMGH